MKEKKPATFSAQPTQREWEKAAVQPERVAAVINSDTETGLWEQCNEDPTLWDRQLRHLLPLVTNERAPDDINS